MMPAAITRRARLDPEDDARVDPTELRRRRDGTTTWAEAATSGDAVRLALAAGRAAGPDVVAAIADAPFVVYAGAGSSLYLAEAAGRAHVELVGTPAIAVPLSELLLRPAAVAGLRGQPGPTVVIVSRSGTTSEAVVAAERLIADGRRVVAVTCRGGSALAAATDLQLVSPAGDEGSIVMTRSFTSMLALLLRAIAGAAGAPGSAVAADLDRLPDRWPESIAAADRAPGIVAAAGPTRVVVLGGGAALGLAREAVLKLTETARIPADAFPPLEFRHGPIAVVEPGVLVVALLERSQAPAEHPVVDEAVALGATAWVLDDRPADGRDERIATTSVGAGLQPLARLPLLMPAIQSLAVSIAIARGHDPDAPRHLGQVVVLPR